MKKMDATLKIVKFPEESGLLIKVVWEKIKMKQNNKKANFVLC